MVSLKFLPYSSTLLLQWGIVKTEVKMPTVENPMLTNVLPLKTGVGQSKAMHALPIAKNFFLVLILDLQLWQLWNLFFYWPESHLWHLWNLLVLKPFTVSVESTSPKATYGVCGIYWP